MMSWYDTHCPVRGPALTHIHHKRHQGCEAEDHTDDMCCECGLTPDTDVPTVRPAPAPTIVPPVAVVKEITAGYVKFEDCPADHRSINTALLIGEKGLEWRRCPMCNTMIEGALRTGVLEGPNYGPGRLPMTSRMWSRWITLLAAWKGGYYKS